MATSHKLVNLHQTAQTNNQSRDANIDEPTKTREPEKNARPKKINSPTSPKKKQSKKIPTEFKRLTNWQEIFLEWEDEEETIQKHKSTPNAIKATVNWGTTKIEPPETNEEHNTDTDNEPSTSTGERRSQRSRRAPQYYGDTVMICDIEKPTTMDKPEIITSRQARTVYDKTTNKTQRTTALNFCVNIYPNRDGQESKEGGVRQG